MIVSEIMDLNDIWQNHNHYYDDMVKFCIDRKRKVIAIDAVEYLFEILKSWIR